MRILLFFDLPTDTSEDIRNYSHFRKLIIKQGFLMMQFSVYVKMINVQTKVERELEKIKKIAPPHGYVNVLHVTDNQYQNMKRIVGSRNKIEEFNDNRKVVFI